jgi:drug/metabolite transporter (DMT)-like permease
LANQPIPSLIAPIQTSMKIRMTWWSYALLSAACWGMQYLLLEILFGKLEFAAAYSFLSVANGFLVALILFIIHPRQNWGQLAQSWPVVGMIFLYLLFGSGAYLFNAYAIRDKNATLASLLEISYPLFIILFTALFLRKTHLNLAGFAGAFLIVGGSILVVASRSK